MACSVPCVVTDTGDTKAMLGSAGVVVPTSNPSALAAAWRRLLALTDKERDAVGARGREIVAERFSMQAVSAQYLSVYETAIAEARS